MTRSGMVRLASMLLMLFWSAAPSCAEDDLRLCFMAARPNDTCLSYLDARIENRSNFTPAEQAKNLANRAHVLFKRTDYEAALRDAQKAIELDAENQTALSTRAVIQLRLGNYDQTIADYSLLVEIAKNRQSTPSFPLFMAMQSKAGALMRAGRFSEAVDVYSDALRNIDESGMSVVSHGGITMVAPVIAARPKDASTLGEARNAASKITSIKRSPVAAEILALRGDAYSALGELDLARKDYEEAQAITPNVPPQRTIEITRPKQR